MENNKLIQMITGKCDILFDGEVLSKESVIKRFLEFASAQIDPECRSLSFAFHTGALCFDVVSIAAVMIGTLSFEFSTNDEILLGLSEGDLVLFRKERYRFNKFEKKRFAPDMPEIDYIVLTQDAKGKNGGSTSWIPFEKNKHLIKPYYGSSTKTDGRGLRRDTSNRNDFLSYVLGIPISEVPTELDISVVVVAEKNDFIDIAKRLQFRYKEGTIIDFLDVVPATYYTNSGEKSQVGKNQAKTEAVIKVTSKLSSARDLVLDRSGNKVIGILVTGVPSLFNDFSELNDIVRRKSLKFACVLAPLSSELSDLAIDQYEEARFFACTKEMLSVADCEVQSDNRFSYELHKHISNILNCSVSTEIVPEFGAWAVYKRIKEKLFSIKQMNWSSEDKDEFILSSLALLNLFTTSFFSMERMEEMIENQILNSTITSPFERLKQLRSITDKNSAFFPVCSEIVSDLTEMYRKIYRSSPKGEMLKKRLIDNAGKKIAVIVPKAYYTDVFREDFSQFGNVVCISANRFDPAGQYDVVVALGDIIGKKYDALKCFAAPEIQLLLYECESKVFSFRNQKAKKSERKLNAKAKGLTGEEYLKAVNIVEDKTIIEEETIKEFSGLDEYVEQMGLFDIRKLVKASTRSGDGSVSSEVKYVGTFTTGEQILFSKYYSAVVFDKEKETVEEKGPDKLLPGDVLVFTKKDDYSRNIVDWIFDQLTISGKLPVEVRESAEKSLYWKTVLREYKDRNSLSFRDIAYAMAKLGSSLQEMTIRQWIVPESHIIGPRELENLALIGKLTNDSALINHAEDFFEACRTVRHYRREILKLMAMAINEKLSNKEPASGSELAIVFDNVDKLSETRELDTIVELEEETEVNINLVNRPITENEVLM